LITGSTLDDQATGQTSCIEIPAALAILAARAVFVVFDGVLCHSLHARSAACTRPVPADADGIPVEESDASPVEVTVIVVNDPLVLGLICVAIV
jgi:hypothetical protein